MDRIKHEADRYNRIYDDQSFAMGEGRYVDACGALSATMKHLKPAPQTLLDVGCGRGEMLDYALRHHFLAGKGTECAMQLVDGRRVEYALLPRLPFDDASFDIVLCLDVLEHLVPVRRWMRLKSSSGWPGKQSSSALTTSRASGAALTSTPISSTTTTGMTCSAGTCRRARNNCPSKASARCGFACCDNLSASHRRCSDGHTGYKP